MEPIARLSVAALDCPDPQVLAEFYSAITGWSIRPDPDGEVDPEWIELLPDAGASIAFQRVGDFVAPQWPGNTHPQQAHLDFDVADLDIGEREVLAIGARKCEFQPGTTFRVFLDPVGHPFCLCLIRP
jgi:predicted enzyme related to lactoylglutathione lyase